MKFQYKMYTIQGKLYAWDLDHKIRQKKKGKRNQQHKGKVSNSTKAKVDNRIEQRLK